MIRKRFSAKSAQIVPTRDWANPPAGRNFNFSARACSPGVLPPKPPCSIACCFYDPAMRSHSGIGRKWRRLNRKFGAPMLVGFLVLIVVAVVGFITYVLSSMSWRPRW